MDKQINILMDIIISLRKKLNLKKETLKLSDTEWKILKNIKKWKIK